MTMNPFHRRGMLGALALLGMGRNALARAAAEPASGTGEIGRRIGAEACEGPVPSAPDLEHERRWKLFQALRRVNERAERREEIQRHLLGGWPPGLDSMHSNARWFRAMSAARRIEAQEDARLDWRDRLYDRIVRKGLGV